MVSHQYFAVPLELSPAQVRKLVKGQSIQLPHAKLMRGIEVVLKKKKATRVHRAHAKSRGVRLQMDPEELEMSGAGFLDFLKKAGTFLKEKVFTNPIYKQVAAPLIKQGLQRGVSALQGAVGAVVPELGAPIGELGNAAVNKLGEVSGAYGMRMRPVVRHAGTLLPASRASLKMGLPLNPHPEMQDDSMPNWGLVEQEQAGARRGRMVKGSAEAKAWGQKMREAKLSRGGSFRLS